MMRIHVLTTALLILAGVPAGAAAPGPATPAPADAQPRPPAPTLKPATSRPLAVDAAGFIRRWLVLEPLPVSGRLTEDEVERVVQAASPPDLLRIPADGESLKSGDRELRWHALDTSLYNLNLYHFAWALSKPTSNVLFQAVTVVDSPREMRDVRLAIGSNAASVWWLNGERVIALYNDRQSVIDDGVSPRMTLRKGRNVIRAIVINGGGATDFCARLLDSGDQPITGLTVQLAAQ